MVQLSATMEQIHETQLVQLYDVLDFQRVIACYNVLSALHETGPWTLDAKKCLTCLVKCLKCHFQNPDTWT